MYSNQPQVKGIYFTCSVPTTVLSQCHNKQLQTGDLVQRNSVSVHALPAGGPDDCSHPSSVAWVRTV